MTIQQMQYYEAVCRLQNITRAAAELHISQPTLSLAMQNLEKELNLNLFRHVGRGIDITAEGHALYMHVVQMLQHMDHFESRVAQISHKHQRVRLALPMQCGTFLLPRLLSDFQQEHPNIELDIIEATGVASLNMVEHEEVDLAVVHDRSANPQSNPHLSMRKLADFPICLCVPANHPLIAKKSLAINDVIMHPLVMLKENFFTSRSFLAKCQSLDLTPNVIHYTPYLSTIWNLVKQHIACGIVTANGLLPGSGLATIPIEGLTQTETIFTKKGRQIYADQRTLMQYIRKICKDPQTTFIQTNSNRIK